MMRRGRIGVMLGLLAGGICAGLAEAQTDSFRLGEGGGWQSSESETELPLLIRDARKLLADNRGRDAYVILDVAMEDGTVPSGYEAQALLLRGDALLMMDREYKALYDYEELISEFPRSPEFRIAIEREYEIAQLYLYGLRRRFFGMRIIGSEDVGIELLIRVQERLPGSQLAEIANVVLADYYFDQREIRLASDTYEVYLENFPNGQFRQHAMKRVIYADLARFKGPRYDSSVLIDAYVQALEFSEVFPAEAAEVRLDEELLVRIDESQAAQLLETAEWHLIRKDLPSTKYMLWRLVQEYPQTISASAAREIMSGQGWNMDDIMPAGLRDRLADEASLAKQSEPESGEEVVIEGPLGDRVESVEQDAESEVK